MGIMPPGIGVWQPSPRRSAGAGFPLAPAPRSDAWLSTPTGWNAGVICATPPAGAAKVWPGTNRVIAVCEYRRAADVNAG